VGTFHNSLGLRLALLGGCFGVILDLDHIPEALGYSIHGRPLHLVGGCLALVLGLLYTYRVRKSKNKSLKTWYPDTIYPKSL
jgi:hypothetical protein